MDSLTQAVLGAAVGEAVLGRKVGRKAAAWGAVAGTLPDLDVLADPFLGDVAALVFHRSLTHALLFGVVTAPLFGMALARLHRGGPATWRDWSWLVFAALFTHPLLDVFTTYGTQVFWPFSRLPVSFNTLFIIDPLYTVPLLTGVLAALWLQDRPALRQGANYLGLGLSTAYILFAVVNKQLATTAFADELQAQGLHYERLATRPTPLNSLLWTAQADDGTGYWIGLYSVLDDEPAIRFQRLEKNAHLLDGLTGDPDVQRLLWFSRGYYRVEPAGDDLLFYDIRFGRNDTWLTDQGDYIFRFRILRDALAPDGVAAVEQAPLSVDLARLPWRPLMARIGGR